MTQEAARNLAGQKALVTGASSGIGKRIGEPQDVAQAVVWFASDQSDYVVGSTLYVDGGMTLYPEFVGGG